MEHLPNGLELRFHPNECDFPRRTPGDNKTNWEFPCYVNKGTHKYSDGKVYDCVGYQFYFEQNESIGLWGIWGHCNLLLRCSCLGYHPHDVEGIYILFDPATEKPCHVYYKAHGLGQGEWKTWEESPKTDDGALIVYFAVNSHATYYRAGLFLRIFGFANDRTADGGQYVRISGDHCVPARETNHKNDGYDLKANIPDLANISISARERRYFPLLKKRIVTRAKAQYV